MKKVVKPTYIFTISKTILLSAKLDRCYPTMLG